MRGRDTHLVVATYNIHRCIGTDRRHDPERVAAVIRELDADVIGLQEVDNRYHVEHGLNQIDSLASGSGYEAVEGPTLRRANAHYGNAILSRRPIVAVRRVDLSVRGREPRGAIDIDIDAAHGRVRVIAAHLGLRALERRAQVRLLLRCLAERDAAVTVLMGDFNEWFPSARTLALLYRRVGSARRLRTFPSWRPLLPLDRIWVQPARSLRELRVHVSPLARTASDHLPVRAAVRLDPG